MRLKIGTRIALVTSLIVAVTLAIYGYISLRTLQAAREDAVGAEAAALASRLRTVIEAKGLGKYDITPLEYYVPWQLDLIDAKNPPLLDERFRSLLTLKKAQSELTEVAGRPAWVHLEPILDDELRVVGAIRLTRDMGFLEAEVRQATIQTILWMLALLVILTIAVTILARRGMGRPIDKLIAGIDDVTRGDLSHVLLQEREDEIGQLASRFNDMTASLREARAETRRGVEAKLSLEAQLRQSEKLATIGQLAAEIAHEVGTPLNVVTGRAKAMAKKASDAEAVQKNASIIAEQAGRITRIIQRLLDFARRRVGDGEKGPVELNDLAKDTLEFLEHQIEGAHIETRMKMDREIGRIPGDKDQIQQVLLNLYMNAIQAMPKGGALEVTTSRVSRRRPGLEVAPEQEYAVLAIADTGEGIAEADRDKIFEPFYTSKAGLGGTGLGLAVAQGIVKEHDGWMEIEGNTDRGRGTVFRIYLPLTETAAPALQDDVYSRSADGGA
jgi:signal transduction histidine kinase